MKRIIFQQQFCPLARFLMSRKQIFCIETLNLITSGQAKTVVRNRMIAGQKDTIPVNSGDLFLTLINGRRLR